MLPGRQTTEGKHLKNLRDVANETTNMKSQFSASGAFHSRFKCLLCCRDFVDGSSESDDTDFSEPSSESSDSSVEETQPRPVFKKSPVIMQSRTFSVTKVPIKKKIVKKDRFYDRSQDIPNDVYFGDVKVPLNVLHTRWASDAEDDSSGPEIVSCHPARFNSGSSSRMK